MSAVPDPYTELGRGASFGPTALLTPANAVTTARLLSAPLLFALVLLRGPSWLALAIWVVVATTDVVDGWIARWHGTTRSGAFLDPLADKLLLLGALVALSIGGYVWWPPVALIGARELAMSLYRARAGRGGVSVPARRSAKLKTLVQDLAVAAALAPAVQDDLPGLVAALLWLAVVLTLLTGWQYLTGAQGSGERLEPRSELRVRAR